MAISIKRAAFMAVGGYLAFLFYGAVPKNMNERFKYRAVQAFSKFLNHVVYVGYFTDPDSPRGIIRFRETWAATEIFFRSGESYGPDVKMTKVLADGVNVNIYSPPGHTDSLLPGFIYIHGGALALCDVEHYDGLTRKLSAGLNAVVMSIDYRRTPENIFSVPFEDSLKATKWFMKHAKDYNVDANRIAMGGDSAGGYLTATVSQAVSDDKSIPNLKLQVLIYPWLQTLDLNTPSYQKYNYEFGSGGIMPLHKLAIYSALHLFGENTDKSVIEAYTKNEHVSAGFRNSKFYKERLSHSLIPESLRNPVFYTAPPDPATEPSHGSPIWDAKKDIFQDERMTPLFRKNLSGLPPAYIITMEYDPIRDDGIIYAKLLEKAGVNVTWKNYEKGFHGIVWVSPGIDFKDGDDIFQEMIQYIKPRL